MSNALTNLQRAQLNALTGDRLAVIKVVNALRVYRVESESLLTAFKELCREHDTQPEEFEREIRELESMGEPDQRGWEPR